MSRRGKSDFVNLRDECRFRKHDFCSIYGASLECEYDICPHANDDAHFNAIVKQNLQGEQR